MLFKHLHQPKAFRSSQKYMLNNKLDLTVDFNEFF